MEVDRNVIPSTSMDGDSVNNTSSTSSSHHYDEHSFLNALGSDNSISEQENDIIHGGDDKFYAGPMSTDSTASQDSDAQQQQQQQESYVANAVAPFNAHDASNAVDSKLKLNGNSSPMPAKVFSGKPKAFAMEAARSVRASKAAATKLKAAKTRRKRAVTVAICTYQSQITDNTVGIKLKLKKSATPVKEPGSRKRAYSAGAATLKGGRKRSRKSKHASDSDGSDYERKRNNNSSSERVRHKKSTKHANDNHDEPLEQSVWGSTIPEHVLDRIFEYAISQSGSLPTIVNAGKVCSLWNRVSLAPKLWQTLDLSTWAKDRNELLLKWIIENRLHPTCTELNLGMLKHRTVVCILMGYGIFMDYFFLTANWKITNIDCVFEYLRSRCPNLASLNMSGWKGITSDHLNFLVTEFKLLSRIDLSAINVSGSNSILIRIIF